MASYFKEKKTDLTSLCFLEMHIQMIKQETRCEGLPPEDENRADVRAGYPAVHSVITQVCKLVLRTFL